MKKIECKSCGSQFPKELAACPRCGAPNKAIDNRMLILSFICIIIALVGAVLWFNINHSLKGEVRHDINHTPEKLAQPVQTSPIADERAQPAHKPDVTDDNARALAAIDDYNTYKSAGNKALMCSYAIVVSSAFLQAKNDTNYKIWRAQSKIDCDAASADTLARLQSK